MSWYANDPRVESTSGHFAVTRAADDRFVIGRSDTLGWVIYTRRLDFAYLIRDGRDVAFAFGFADADAAVRSLLDPEPGTSVVAELPTGTAEPAADVPPGTLTATGTTGFRNPEL